MGHKVKVSAVPLEGSEIAQGFDVHLFVDDQPFEATKLTLVAEAGRAVVKAIVEFGVSELEFDGYPETTFLALGSTSTLTAEEYKKAVEDLRRAALGIE
jgi:hypothetical protein